MEYDDLQTIWNSQTSSPLFKIEERDLAKRLQNSASNAVRIITFFEYYIILGCIIFGLVLITEPIFEGKDFHHYITGPLCWFIAIFVYSLRRKRLTRINNYDQSVFSQLENNIIAIKDTIKVLKASFKWFLIVISIVSFIDIYFNFETRPLWKILLSPIGLLVFYTSFRILIVKTSNYLERLLRLKMQWTTETIS